MKLWQFHLGAEGSSIVPRTSAFSFEDLARDTDGLSGGDIRNITLRVCTHLVRLPEEQRFLTNDLVLKEVELYKQSLSDMREKKAKPFQPEVVETELTGKDKEDALKALDANGTVATED